MLLQRINRSDPEKIFVVVYNSYSTAAITVGQFVNWDFLTDADGVGVSIPTARATNAGFAAAGVVASSSIASGAYGLVQVYGFHTAARVRAATSANPDVEAGTPLGAPALGVWCMESIETSSTAIIKFPCAFSFATATWVTAAIDVFIKAM